VLQSPHDDTGRATFETTCALHVSQVPTGQTEPLQPDLANLILPANGPLFRGRRSPAATPESLHRRT
jgi:hypothetical protein